MIIAVLGAGSWGTALAAMAAESGHVTRLWGRDPDQMQELARTRRNARYLPGLVLPAAVLVTADFDQATAGAELVVIALPSPSVRPVATRLARAHRARLEAGRSAARTAPPAPPILVCASKGLEETSRLTLDRVLAEAFPGAKVVLFSGPTFAVEIARGLPAAAVVASTDAGAAGAVQRAFASELFRVYTTEDVTGVALGGALKNVIAIAAGCADGFGFGSNARAALITRGLNEMGRLTVKLGGNPMTLAGLAGLGDLVLTCTGELSRNRKVGLALAAGKPLAEITAELGQVAEGVFTARIAAELAEELGVDMPIICRVAAVLAGRTTAREAVADLLARESRPERG